MGRPRKVPMIAGGVERLFDPQHAKNILIYQANGGRHPWALVENSGFTFENNELRFKPNTEVNKRRSKG